MEFFPEVCSWFQWKQREQPDTEIKQMYCYEWKLQPITFGLQAQLLVSSFGEIDMTIFVIFEDACQLTDLQVLQIIKLTDL